MNHATVPVGGVDMAVTHLDGPQNAAGLLVWAHGWGQTSSAFMGLARTFERMNPSVLIDFPGFGRSQMPPGPWGTAEYADAVAEWLRTLSPRPLIWIGHSFGCRVGLQIAARHPGLLHAMVLIAAAGLPRRRTLLQQLRIKARVWTFKLARTLARSEEARERLRARFGSVDYRNAGPMRPVLVKVIQEDLSDVATKVSCPVLLLYGSGDTETPPEIGVRLSGLIKESSFITLDGYDHHTILGRGQHQVANHMRKFIDRVA